MEASAKAEDVGTIRRERVWGPDGVSDSSLPWAMWYACTPSMA